MRKCAVKDHLGNDYTSVKDLCAHYGLSTNVYTRRVQRNWPLERILTTPVKSKKMVPRHFVYDHLAREYPDLQAMCSVYHLDLQTFFARKNRGWTLETILTTTESETDGKCVDHCGRVFASVTEMCNYYDISYPVFYYRIQNGWGMERALTEPVQPQATRCRDHLGRDFGSQKEMCQFYQIPFKTYQSRIRGGWSVERALTEQVQKKCKDSAI